MKKHLPQFLSAVAVIILFTNVNIVAQSYSYKNKNFDWPAEKPAAIMVEPQFADEDAVILEEQAEFSILKDQVDIRNNNHIVKHLRIKFLTEKGIAKYSKFILPEPFDPSFEYQSLEIWKRDSVHRPKANLNALNYFVVRIIKPDGTFETPKVQYTSSFESFYYSAAEHRFYDYQFAINNLKVNDEIEIYYSIEDVFTSKRIFFNAEIPIQNLKYSFMHYRNRTYMLDCFNDSEPHDTIRDNNTVTYKWEFKNLTGCMDEPGGRYYKELPNFTYYEHFRDFGQYNSAQTDIDVAWKYNWHYVLQPLVNYNLNHDTLKDRDNLKVKHLFDDYTFQLKDTNASERFVALNNLIVDSFNYQVDLALFKGEDIRNVRLAEFIEKRVLREISRKELYEKLIYLLNTNYFKSYPQDKRVAELDFNHFTPFTIGYPYYCILKNDQSNYFFPKNHRFGFYRNEIPFYYEDANVILIPQREKEDEYYKTYKQISYLYTKMPYSSVHDNKRNTSVNTMVSLDSMKITFNAKVKLSGQYSTLQRGYYQYAYYDSTINSQYFKGVHDDIKGMKLLSNEKLSGDKEFPFATDFSLKYSSDKIIEKEKDGIYKIDLAQWFKHIYLPGFTSAKRVTSFFPDFAGFDEYKYYLKFDKNINITDTSSMDFETSNEFGIYKFKITQLQPDVVLLQSTFVINENQVLPDKTIGVEKIYNFIEQLNKKKLAVKID